MIWAQLEAIVKTTKAGPLHDGKVIKSVRLIFPARKSAIAIYDRAIKAGFEMVTYPQGSVLMQVNPP